MNCARAAEHVPPRAAVERGLLYLKGEAFAWKDTRKCAACHHAATMLWAFNEARVAGYSVDDKAGKVITEWAFQDMALNARTGQPPPRNLINLGWVYLLLSVETAPIATVASNENAQHLARESAGTNATARLTARETLIQEIVAKQASDGSWGKPLDLRVPLGGPPEDIAILSRLALIESADNSKAVLDCIARAGAWLNSNHDSQSRQARNLRLLMNIREGKSTDETAASIASIRAEQNADGGWSQTAEMPSDAYATGQALYVLIRAGVDPTEAEVERGVEFLIRTQRADGSWPMTSRVKAKNLSPITGAGTAWALLGLIRATH